MAIYIGNQKVNPSGYGKIYVGNNLVYQKQQPTETPIILEVERFTTNNYVESTAYTNDSFIALKVGVKANSTAIITYNNVNYTLTNSTNSDAEQNWHIGKWAGVDDGTATSGTLTITGDYYSIGSIQFNLEKFINTMSGGITGITSLGKIITFNGFRGIYNSLPIPKSLTTLNIDSNYYTPLSTCNVSVANGNPTFTMVNGCLMEGNSVRLILNGTIPNTATTISKNAISPDSEQLTIPPSITTILELNNLLSGTAIALKRIYISDLSAYCRINFSFYITPIDKELYLNGEKITDLVIPNDITILTGITFYYFDFNTITIPNNVISMSDSTFATRSNSNLTTMNVGNGIKDLSLANLPTLTTLNLSEGLEKLDFSVDTTFSNLTSLTIPSSVIKLGHQHSTTSTYRSGFAGFTNLTSVSFVDDTATWNITNANGTQQVSVNNPTTNVTNLKTTYKDYYWEKVV